MDGASTCKRTTRGTPKGGVLSPLLWRIVINTILCALRRKKINIITYADAVGILTKRRDLQTIKDIMKAALKEISLWAGKNGLVVHPQKTKPILFTRRYLVF